MDSLWGFRVGDIITDDNKESDWHRKRVEVKSFSKDSKGNLLLCGKADNSDKLFCADKPDGLILLERPGLKFKIEDKVKAVDSKPELKGTVIVIDPSSDDHMLVEFKEWIEGHNGYSWGRPWYPQKYKTESLSRWWCSVEKLVID